MTTIHPDLDQEYKPPRTPSEIILAEIFAEVLRLERVGVSDNFFSLGGNSLTAVKVIVRIRAALGKSLPLWILFKSGSVAALAEQIDRTPAAMEKTSPRPAPQVHAPSSVSD